MVGSIIVNGSPTDEFQFYKGLKHGDPLSPFLFILVIETLHISFQRVVDAGLFNGIVLGPDLHLSHMFYADDAVFVGQWSDANIDTLVLVLDCFHRASGLKVGGFMSRIQSWNELDIVHETETLKNKGIDVFNCMKIKLGNGENTMFWDDIWCGDIALKYLYPRLYLLESCKSVKVASKLSHSSLEFSFRRSPRGGAERDRFLKLAIQIEDVMFTNSRDRWTWTLEGSGEFSVASVRKMIDDKLRPKLAVKTRWIKSFLSR
nr:RNA-directed DNA polymerase, eukaryota, reverse transcriptase zinc-binding domain protein [Tanacetum cinerariifolium]